MPKALVSVIIPCYNYAHYLRDAVASVLRQKGDNLDLEIIVVDDGSKDTTPAVAQELGSRIRYIRQDNQGLSAARNTGIREAKGDFLVFLDADDLLGPDNLQSHLDNFAAHPELDLSVSICVNLQENTSKGYLWPLKSAHLDMHLCYSNISPVHTFMLKSQTAHDVGFFDPDFAACEDQDYWLRCAALGKGFGINLQSFVVYRLHAGSMVSQITRQHAHDSVMRFKVSHFLEKMPAFPKAGKFYGWLAHAAGCLNSAAALSQSTPSYAQKLLEESAKAIAKAASYAPDAEVSDQYLILAERYFTADFLLKIQRLESLSVLSVTGMADKAQDLLGQRNPSLFTASPEALAARCAQLSRRLCFDLNAGMEIIQKAGILNAKVESNA